MYLNKSEMRGKYEFNWEKLRAKNKTLRGKSAQSMLTLISIEKSNKIKPELPLY